MLVDIVLVNWNTGPQIAETISSICKHHYRLVSSIVVIDNASTDKSLDLVVALKNIPFDLKIIRNTENRGFGAACNQGAALSSSEYLLFLNPDTLLFESSLMVPLNFMQQPENAKVGIVGIQLLDENNQIARSCSRFPSLGILVAQALGINRFPGLRHLSQAMIEWEHDCTRQVDQVIGAFFLMRRSVFLSLGGFDERYFVYFEEVDFSLRARKKNWQSIFLANSQAFHAGGGASNKVKAHRLFYSLRSRLLYGFKHFKPLQAWFLLGVSLGLEPISRVMFSILRGVLGDVRNTLDAYGMLYRDLPNILKIARRL